MSLEDTSGRNVLTRYGVTTTDEKFGGTVATRGRVKQLVVKFSWDDLPDPTAATTTFSGYVPDGAIIKDAWFKVFKDSDGNDISFATGTEGYAIGLQNAAGTEIDDDGLFDSVTLAEMNVGATARDHTFALQDLAITADAYVIIAEVSTAMTAGEGEVIIEYIL